MAELEAGTAYLQLVAGAAGLQKDVDQKVKKVNAPAIIAKIDGEISGLQKKRAEAQQILDGLRQKVTAQADLDIKALEARKAVAEGKLEELSRKKASPQVELQQAKLNADLGRINSQIDRLSQRKATPEVDAQVARAETNLSKIDRQITVLNGKRAQVQVNAAGAAAAGAQLDVVQGKANRLNGSRASVNIAAAGGAQASGMLGAIVAGLAAVAAAAPAAVAALGAVSAAASGIGQAAGAATAGFSGIGDAIKAVEADEKSAATSSAGAAKSRSNSANQIASAQGALAQAVIQADRAAITGGQQVAQARQQAARTQIQGADSVADASRAVARAQQQADRTAVTSGQQLAAARRAVADAVVAAAERNQAAERSVARAQESARYAQESLTRARRDAAEANDDLQLSLSGVAISEKRAALQLRKALAARAGGGDVDPQMFKSEELDLDVAEAAQNLAEVRERFGDLRSEQARFAATGVEGSDQVIAAQRAVRDANMSVEDSVRSLVQTQRDGSRSVSDAVAAQAQAQQQAAWAQQDAQAGVADAQIAAGRAARDAAWANQDAAAAVQQAVQQSAWAQQDAAKGVADAQRGLQEALAASAEQAGAAGAAGKKSAYELSMLTPAGRSFVAFWLDEWKPAMQDVSDSVASEMLPRVERAMRQLLGLQPELKAGLSGTGAILGDLAVKGSDLATSPAFRASFVQIMDSNNRALSSWGNAAISGADSARALTVAGLPLSERLARMAEGASQSAESFLLQKESTGELSQAMQFGADKAGQLLDVVLELATAAFKVGQAIAPVGEVVLNAVGGIAEFIGEFAEANQGLTQFLVTAGLAVAGVNALAKSIVAVKASAAIAGGGLSTLTSILTTGLNPSALYNTQLMTRMRDGAKSVAPAVSTYAQGLTGSATAGTLAGKATTGFTTAATRLAAGLPLVATAVAAVAIANDALNTSFDEGVEKMGKGGAAATAFRQELAANDVVADKFSDGIGTWVRQNLFGIETTESFSKKLREQRQTWTDLQNAQYDAGAAQGYYEEAVRRFGANSPAALSTLRMWKDASRDVEIAQIAVREKTDLATAALIYQRDQILAGLDADLRLRMSKQQLAKDQQALNDAIRQNGPSSQQAIDAQNQLEMTQLRTAESAKASAGGNKAYTDSVIDMVKKSGGQLTPTLAGMVAGLDATSLATLGAKVRVDELGRTVVSMPGQKDIVVNVNDAQAISGITGVLYQLGQVPPGKAITVTTLDLEAQAKLRALGFTVTTLPNGQVQVTANDQQARNTLIAFQAFAAWQVANPKLAADPAIANQKMREFLDNAGRQTGVPALDADPARADATVRAKLDEFNRWNATPAIHADTKPADDGVKGWWQGMLDWFKSNPAGPEIAPGRVAPGIGQGRAEGGLITGYASGGRIQRKQVFTGMDRGGRVRGPGGPTADRVPIMGSAGEYMVRARAVNAVGVPFLDAINGMRDGGYLGHYAAGGKLRPQAGGAAPTTGAAVPSAPAGADGAAGATNALAGAMDVAAGAAGSLQPALADVTAQQQAMVSSGVAPLTGALNSMLVPALASSSYQVGTVAPLAHTALQGAQTATQVSTAATALNAQANNAGIATSTALMSQQGQLQHAGLRAGQVATQTSTNLTAQNTALNNAAMAATTTGMSVQAQAQHAGLRGGQAATQTQTNLTALNAATNNANMAATTAGMSQAAQLQHNNLRLGQGATQVSSNLTAQNLAGNNLNMQVTTGQMRATNEGHLAGLRGAQGTTTQSTIGFADSWKAQLGRTVPDSANPLRHVINVPIGGVVGAWNTIDSQFALGKHVDPPRANFARGGVMPGYTPGRDTMTANVSGGEAIMRPEWTRAIGSDYIGAANQAARSGGVRGVQQFLSGPQPGGRREGRVKQRLMTRFPLDGPPAPITGRWAGAFAYGGVAPHVAAAGDAVVRALGPMPGGIGGRGARGNESDHPSGFALDFMTLSNMPLGDRVAGMLQAQAEPMAVKYIIWKQAINQGRGWNPMENRGSPTANHLDHVHASFEGGPLGGKWGDGPMGGAMFDFGAIIREAFKFVYGLIADVPKIFGASPQVERGAGIPKAGADMAIESLIKKLGEMFAFSGGGNVEAFRPLVLQALAMLGQPASLADITLRRMNQESSGNPRIVNDWDANARAGWPTKGLMQMRDDTFLDNWDPRTPRDIFNPLSNIVSSMRYAIGKYGSLAAAYNKPGGYDNGGLLMPGRTLVENNTGFPERVLDNVETRSYDTLTRLVGNGGIQVDLGPYEPQQRGDVHILENGVIRETADADQVMQRVEFLAGTGSL